MSLKEPGYFRRIGISIDQLGAALCAQDPDVTFSGVIGYQANVKRRGHWMWSKLEDIVDWTFYPWDGPAHCLQAYNADIRERYRRGSDVAWFFTALIVVLSCIPISMVAWGGWLLKRLFKR